MCSIIIMVLALMVFGTTLLEAKVVDFTPNIKSSLPCERSYLVFPAVVVIVVGIYFVVMSSIIIIYFVYFFLMASASSQVRVILHQVSTSTLTATCGVLNDLYSRL